MTSLLASAPLRLDLAGRELEPLAPLVADAAVFSWPLERRATVRLERRADPKLAGSRVESGAAMGAGGLALEVDPWLDAPGDEGALAVEAWALRALPPPWPALVQLEGPREQDLGGLTASALALLAALARARGETREDLVELARSVVARATYEPEPRAGIAAARQGSPRVGVRRLGERTVVAAPTRGAVETLLRTRLALLRDTAAGKGPTARAASTLALQGEDGAHTALGRAAEASRAIAEAVLLDRAASLAPLMVREAEALEAAAPTSPRDRDVSWFLGRAGALVVRRLGDAGLVVAIAEEGRLDALKAAGYECGLAELDAKLGSRGLTVEEVGDREGARA